MKERSKHLSTSSGHSRSIGDAAWKLEAQFPSDPRISRRWEWWLPWVRLAKLPLEQSRKEHERRLCALLREGLEMRKIARRKLDDPRLSDTNFGNLLREIKSNVQEKEETNGRRYQDRG